jgi:ubiquinone/menaquinone biosynthesis C-methylase UbiE
VRGLAESTGYADASWDLVVFSFIAHECPQQALRDFVKEARRIVKKGGVVCFVDNNPRCAAVCGVVWFCVAMPKHHCSVCWSLLACFSCSVK